MAIWLSARKESADNRFQILFIYIDILQLALYIYIATGAIQLINVGLAQAHPNNGACHQ